MRQRFFTHVLRTETLPIVEASPYHEGSKYTIEDADLLFASVPYKIMHRFALERYKRTADIDAKFYDDLKRVGFMLDFGDDGSGFYIDVGASDLVIKGEINLKSGVTLNEMRGRSVVLSDKTEVEADLVVYATGYGSMNEWVAKLISREVADKVGKCWGLGSYTKMDPGSWEHEIRNTWKPTQQQGLWFHGGAFLYCRQYSLYLALQIKARMEGIPIHVYGMGKVHHMT